jgi:hypothetical protein
VIPPIGGVPRSARKRGPASRPLRIAGFTLLVIALVVLGLLLFTHAF